MLVPDNKWKWVIKWWVIRSKWKYFFSPTLLLLFTQNNHTQMHWIISFFFNFHTKKLNFFFIISFYIWEKKECSLKTTERLVTLKKKPINNRRMNRNQIEIWIQKTTSWFLTFQVNNTLALLKHTHTQSLHHSLYTVGILWLFMKNLWLICLTRNVLLFLWQAIKNKWIEEIVAKVSTRFIHYYQ